MSTPKKQRHVPLQQQHDRVMCDKYEENQEVPTVANTLATLIVHLEASNVIPQDASDVIELEQTDEENESTQEGKIHLTDEEANIEQPINDEGNRMLDQIRNVSKAMEAKEKSTPQNGKNMCCTW